MDRKPDFVMQTFIRCTQDALWEALTDPEVMAQYHFLCSRVELADDAITYFTPDGHPMLKVRELERDPKTRIVSTFEPGWEGEAKPSKTVYLIQPEGPYCSLTLEHYDLTFPVVHGEGVADGWARWAAGLKTFLETGETVRFSNPAAVGA